MFFGRFLCTVIAVCLIPKRAKAEKVVCCELRKAAGQRFAGFLRVLEAVFDFGRGERREEALFLLRPDLPIRRAGNRPHAVLRGQILLDKDVVDAGLYLL